MQDIMNINNDFTFNNASFKLNLEVNDVSS